MDSIFEVIVKGSFLQFLSFLIVWLIVVLPLYNFMDTEKNILIKVLAAFIVMLHGFFSFWIVYDFASATFA